MMTRTLLAALILFVHNSCATKVDYYKTPSFSTSGALHAVIEIPAGTNTKYEYDPATKQYVVDQENGRDRVIDFLPYPGNYGFIPSTLSDKNNGGDGDALDVLVLSESRKTGEIVEVQPIALLKLIDAGEQDYKIIAIPSNEKQRVVKAANFADLQKHYPALIEIVEIWFLNYNTKDVAQVEGWGDEQEALEEIRRAVKN